MDVKVDDLKMLHDNVLIEPLEEDDNKPSAIQLPDSAKKKDSFCGKVRAVGPGVYCMETGKVVPLTVQEGSKVYYRQWAGSDIKLGDDEKLKVMQEKDILAVVSE